MDGFRRINIYHFKIWHLYERPMPHHVRTNPWALTEVKSPPRWIISLTGLYLKIILNQPRSLLPTGNKTVEMQLRCNFCKNLVFTFVKNVSMSRLYTDTLWKKIWAPLSCSCGPCCHLQKIYLSWSEATSQKPCCSCSHCSYCWSSACANGVETTDTGNLFTPHYQWLYLLIACV